MTGIEQAAVVIKPAYEMSNSSNYRYFFIKLGGFTCFSGFNIGYENLMNSSSKLEVDITVANENCKVNKKFTMSLLINL